MTKRSFRLASRRSLVAATSTAVIALFIGGVSAQATTARMQRAPKVVVGHYDGILLALGDSLAAGYEPTFGDNPPPISTETGKPDQGYPGGYAADLAKEHDLLLIDLACPGETTSSMTMTPAKAACLTGYKDSLGATSQLAAAEDLIAAEGKKIKLVTFDLGANNVDGCVSSRGLNASCVASGESAIVRQLPATLSAIKGALALKSPGAAMVAMNYYDPFLGIAFTPGGVIATAGATISIGSSAALNASLGLIYKHAGIPVANVSGAFRTNAVKPLVTYGGKRLPLDVAEVCKWTFMCPLKGSTITANIHPNVTGYAVIAAAFAPVIPSSVP